MASPLLLAIETSGPTPGVALARGEELLREVALRAGPGSAETLLPTIDGMLADAGVALEAVVAFAVSIGPGSFTGLRVGVATVKGLAFASNKPVAPVSTLAALAHAHRGAGRPGAALLDARRGELYAAVYTAGCAVCRLEEGIYTPEELAPGLPEGCLLVGEGAALAGAALLALGAPGLELGASVGGPAARAVAELGAAALARGGGVCAASLVPRYLRRAQAEALRTGRPVE